MEHIKWLLAVPVHSLLYLNYDNRGHKCQEQKHKDRHDSAGLYSNANVLMGAFKLIAFTQSVVEEQEAKVECDIVSDNCDFLKSIAPRVGI